MPGYSFTTCRGVAKWLESRTGLPFQVHKTDRYLHLTYTLGSVQRVERVRIPGRVLYCLKEEHLQPLVDRLNGSATRDILRSESGELRRLTEELRELLHFTFQNRSYPDLGYHKMSDRQKELYAAVAWGSGSPPLWRPD